MLVSDGIKAEALTPAICQAFAGPDRDVYLRAYDRLNGAGYGAGVARAFASAAPRVAEHAGSAQAIAIAADASRIAIKARPRLAATYLELCPAMAVKLRNAADFQQWRGMIAAVLGRSPKAVGAVLDRADLLLDRLGLEGFCAWTETGLMVGELDTDQTLGFFRLETPEAQRLLERYAGEANFPSLEAGLTSFHTALWRHAPVLREAVADASNRRARRTGFSDGIIRMPASFPGFKGQEQQLYRAALAHVGAHAAYGGPRFPLGQLKPLQLAVISLIEDARVEALALRDMPGLIRLWLPFHTARFDGLATAPNLFAGLARALIDPASCPTHGWIRKGVAMFDAASGRLDDPAISREIGNILGNDLGQIRVQFDALSYVVQPAYRDDNLGLWDLPDDPDTPPPSDEIEVDLHTARNSEVDDRPQDRTQEQTVPDAQARLDTVKIIGAPLEGGRKVSCLPEYDHCAGIERDDWVTVNSYEPVAGDHGFWDALRQRHGTTIARINHVIVKNEAGKRRRLKQQAEGETLDLDAAVDAVIAIRAARQPDDRVYACILPPERSFAVHLVLDISQSTADLAAPGISILDMERDAAAILAGTMQQLGDDLAITAFSSAGRHDVRVIPIKTFGSPLDEATGRALAGLRPGFSTRIGAALRFASQRMQDVSRYRKLVLLVTDGAPSDIDVADPEYLVADARRAVQTMRSQGIDAVCVALGPDAGQRQSEIFGRKSCAQITDIATLPSTLSAFYLRMTR
ncbi:von Willebrand factor, type A [Roseovarius sp. EC-HK134]|uniref:nitric oxide reductase activation protein NorD n=1 Tax=unclassified Roseovarius TaxID=2614913 RepID=UPI001256361E|nr:MULTISPECIES: VWA domain-containing protein [unclassified Roseovarius]VVS97978.1 von Willebrand factor, type A [Roseovarius sp. EC-HK134]VVS98815.1 von Willebrand factor, type A [Roseovarius sp. EC-SD190]